jgi:tRNA(His) 5'-end guanylyltransferase
MRPHPRLRSVEESVADHKELTRLLEVFGRIETDSLTQERCPEGQFLCIRLDGIKVSKQHLKDRLSHPQFREALSRAILGAYYLLRWHSKKENKNFFLCALALSDEVTFILNNRTNYYDNRSFKIGTMLAGCLSGFMSLYFQPPSTHHARKSKHSSEGAHPEIVAFDARPLLLESYRQVDEYIQLRQLMGRRNSMCKALRLRKVFSDSELYDTELKNDVPRLTQAIAAHGLEKDLQQALDEFRLFVPDEESKLHEHALLDLSDGDALGSLRAFHAWLNA